MSTNRIRAIGLLNTDMSAEDQAADGQKIEAIAAARGYDLRRTLKVNSATYMLVTLIVHTATAAKACAVVAPDLGHFGGAAAVRAVTMALAVEHASGTEPRLSRAST